MVTAKEGNTVTRQSIQERLALTHTSLAIVVMYSHLMVCCAQAHVQLVAVVSLELLKVSNDSVVLFCIMHRHVLVVLSFLTHQYMSSSSPYLERPQIVVVHLCYKLCFAKGSQRDHAGLCGHDEEADCHASTHDG